MSSTLLEQLRRARQDVDIYEASTVKQLDVKARSQAETIEKEHRVLALLQRAMGRSGDAVALLEDQDGSMKEEVDSMRGTSVFTTFYSRLKDLQDYHRRFPDVHVDMANPDAEALDVPLFTGEEFNGKFLDLHEHFERYVNLPGVERVDYLTYVEHFKRFDRLPLETKQAKAYKEYLALLATYMESFYRRTQPLVDADGDLAEAQAAFEEAWSKGSVPGWSEAIVEAAVQGLARVPKAAAADVGGIRLDEVNSVEELLAVDPKLLKEALEARGLKCGGTSAERAERLFSVRGLAPSEYPPETLAVSGGKRVRKRKRKETAGAGSGAKKSAAELAAEARERANQFKEIARQEHMVRHIANVVSSVVRATQELAEKRQTRTHAELVAERAEEEEAARALAEESEEDSDAEEEEAPIYNPKNVPLGWDGKPIPYWLFKLHGLRVEYDCEICGNVKYRGRRNFERHFSEWRHAYGMRCLNIPNTKHFFGVTKIKDAIELHAKIKGEVVREDWRPEVEEEFEDSEGNVMNRKTFDDLTRQGLL